MTPTATSQQGTGMRTLADLAALAAEKYGDKPAMRLKRDGAWEDVSFAEVGTIVEEIGLGLIDLGLEPGDRVCILCNTRPEWTYADLAIPAAGGVVVPIYPTNSPEECEWVAGNSQAKVAVVEDAEQLAKIRAVRDELPDLHTVIVVDPSGDTEGAIPLDEVRERGRARDGAELEQRRDGVKGDDTFTIIYTSGTTGNPKGCVLTHDNYRFTVTACESVEVLEADETTYLFLPLAHAFALLIQLLSVDLGGDDRLLRRRHQADRARAVGGQADLPAVGAADLREDLHARHGERPAGLGRGPAALRGRGQARRLGAPDAPARRGRARRGPGALRRGGREALQERARAVRRPAQAGGHRRGTDRA